MLRITELRLPLDHAEGALRPAVVSRLGIADADLTALTVFKRAYDARKKTAIQRIYTLDVTLATGVDEAALLKAGADAEARGLASSRRTNTESLEKLKAGGMQILPASPQLKADMKKVGDVMLKEWLEKAGPEGKQLIDAFSK